MDYISFMEYVVKKLALMSVNDRIKANDKYNMLLNSDKERYVENFYPTLTFEDFEKSLYKKYKLMSYKEQIKVTKYHGITILDKYADKYY
jgi:hypothetical protein